MEPTGADAVDILVDVRVEGIRLVSRIAEPSPDAGVGLRLSLLSEEGVDGGLGGGEGDALGDDDLLHCGVPLSCPC